MPATTTQAYITTGDWSADTRAHPALKWFEPVVRDIFDKHRWTNPSSDIYTSDVTLLKPDGGVVQGGDAAWAEVARLFGTSLTRQRTVPQYVVMTETEYGWDMIATAWVYGDLVADGGSTQGKVPKIQDHDGGDWDVKMSGAFRFQFVKDAGGPIAPGILLKRVEIMVDSSGVLMRLLAGGVVSLQDLGLA